MFSQLEDLDYADDIALLSTNARHLQQKANALNENAKKAGLHINIKKTKVMHLNLTEPHPQIMIDGGELEAVNDFTNLGSNISAENSVQKDISARIIYRIYRILPYPTLQFTRGVGKREKANGLCNPLMILFRWIFS